MWAEQSLVLTFEELAQAGVGAFHKEMFYPGSDRNNTEEHLPWIHTTLTSCFTALNNSQAIIKAEYTAEWALDFKSTFLHRSAVQSHTPCSDFAGTVCVDMPLCKEKKEIKYESNGNEIKKMKLSSVPNFFSLSLFLHLMECLCVYLPEVPIMRVWDIQCPQFISACREEYSFLIASHFLIIKGKGNFGQLCFIPGIAGSQVSNAIGRMENIKKPICIQT